MKQFFHILVNVVCLSGAGGLIFPAVSFAEGAEIKKTQTGLYQDFFDQNIYREWTSYLHFENLYRKITQAKSRSANVNVYDQVPDSAFFVNRHARNPMLKQDLEQGYSETSGPDTSGPLTIVSGKFEGLHPGFFVKDSKGDAYLIKFDDIDNFELQTSAEVIASRLYYAMGYHVPQYTITTFSPGQLVPGSEAKVRDDTGFKKPLTQERLDEYLLFLPQDGSGNYRASASKIIEGQNKGNFFFYGKRKEDPLDDYYHENRREIRALAIFASWLNNYDVRESNTLDMVVNENGKSVLKHYLIDFNAALGAGSLYPMFAYEHMVDYGEALKAFLSLGLWEKPWQRRWREMGSQGQRSPAVGNFESDYFRPEDYKVQFPHYAFKYITRADGFWAAKVIMSFTNEDIQAAVRAGKLSDPKDEDYVSKVLIERRDKIGQYWFDQAAPLDQFDVKNGTLVFENLRKKYGWDSDNSSHHVQVDGLSGKKKSKIDAFDFQGETLDLKDWLNRYDEIHLKIRAEKAKKSGWTPYVLVKVSSKGIAGIHHED